jgi:choline dehydrogenase-like flavoprotein
LVADARHIPTDVGVEADPCIVGAGAAGITLARSFIDAPFRVALLESGGFEPEQRTQALYKGPSIGLRYYPLDSARERYFGGTTNHWEGFCRPFDAIDF